ncbi:uncharacterized protein LOC134670621 isoform X2 [Cydia fagiglandana]|uniref:uncharacterized protein LOC134670621 isoform X2 n=1 Tax=Cydia fagiglandana TaxID=1458189 RepID=UPI002FEDEC80
MNRETYQRYREPKPCFIPTCPRTDKKNPGLKFFAIRKELKERWCQLVGRNCPKRDLYCCEEHLNVEEDLENYEQWTSGAKPRLKMSATLKNFSKNPLTANVNIMNTEDISRPSTSSGDGIRIPHNIDVAVQCEKKMGVSNKSIMAQPQTQDRDTQIRGRIVKKKCCHQVRCIYLAVRTVPINHHRYLEPLTSTHLPVHNKILRKASGSIC